MIYMIGRKSTTLDSQGTKDNRSSIPLSRVRITPTYPHLKMNIAINIGYYEDYNQHHQLTFKSDLSYQKRLNGMEMIVHS